MRAIVGSILLGMAAGAAQAQGFQGAELSAEVLGFTDDFGSGQTTYRGSVEFDAFMGLGVAADLSYQGFRGLGSDNRNLTLHALYELGGATAGGFWSRDALDDDESVTTYGIEGATTFGGAAVEGYAGRVDGVLEDGSVVGVDASFTVMGLGVTAGLSHLDVNGSEGSRISAGAEYSMGLGPTLYGELGRITGDDSQTYLTLGARIAIGPNAGTTFGSRGVFDALPGR